VETIRRFRLLPTAANGQPAFVLYTDNKTDRTWVAHSLHLLEVDAGRKAYPLRQTEWPGLIAAFGFPLSLKSDLKGISQLNSSSRMAQAMRGAEPRLSTHFGHRPFTPAWRLRWAVA
jgi:hypothetical protein